MATVNLGVDFIYNGFLMVFCQYFFLYSHLVMYLVYVRFLWYSDKLPRIIVNFVIIAMAEPLLVVILVISFLLVGFLYYLSYKTISPAYAMYYIPPAKRDGLSPVQIGEIVIDAELLAKLLNPTLHTVPRRKVPCTNDIESFIQVFKYKGNKRYERLLYNRKIDYNVHYVYTSFLTRVPNVTLKADERLPDIAMLVRRTLLIYRDMEWQGKETRLINQYLNDLNKDLIPVLVEYYWHLLKEEKLHAEKDFFVLFLLHSQMASFIGLDPTDFE